ncbi:hypothetical protein ACX40Y_09595 [Sphingomonas sp. RS6]
MMGLVTIVFLAAVVGVIKPYIPNLTRKHFGIAAAVSFVLMMIVVPKPDSPNVAAASEKTEKVASTPNASSPSGVAEKAPAEPAVESKWSYSEDKDEMRGSTTKFASIESNNEIDLDFPYGVTTGTLTVRKNPESGLNVMFSVESGQVLCNGFTDTYISMKFDDGPVQKMSCTGTSDGSSETAFFTNEGRVLAGLKKAKRTVVEAEFFQKGRQQFVFDTSGLQWK